MPQVIIENPILNSPYEEPGKHFRFSDEGITNDIVDERRVSSYFMPIPAAKKRGRQLAFDTEWTKDRLEENKFINRIRGRVAQWRRGPRRAVVEGGRRAGAGVGGAGGLMQPHVRYVKSGDVRLAVSTLGE